MDSAKIHSPSEKTRNTSLVMDFRFVLLGMIRQCKLRVGLQSVGSPWANY